MPTLWSKRRERRARGYNCRRGRGRLTAAFLGGGRVNDPPPPPASVTQATKQVVGTITQFQRALSQGDFATICGNLFSLEAREAAGGDRCPSVLADTAGGLRDPRVEIVSITHRGNTATAVVRARTGSAPPVTDTIRLVRQGGRYKIVSAGKETGEK
jgi:hypothetical protein